MLVLVTALRVAAARYTPVVITVAAALCSVAAIAAAVATIAAIAAPVSCSSTTTIASAAIVARRVGAVCVATWPVTIWAAVCKGRSCAVSTCGTYSVVHWGRGVGWGLKGHVVRPVQGQHGSALRQVCLAELAAGLAGSFEGSSLCASVGCEADSAKLQQGITASTRAGLL